MVELHFHTLMQRSPLLRTSRGGFRVFGSLVLQIPQNTPVARYVTHHWELDAQRTSSFECSDRTTLRFESAGSSIGPFGPFQHLRFPNGYCYANQALIAAFLPDNQRWRYTPDGSEWDAIIIEPAPGRTSATTPGR